METCNSPEWLMIQPSMSLCKNCVYATQVTIGFIKHTNELIINQQMIVSSHVQTHTHVGMSLIWMHTKTLHSVVCIKVCEVRHYNASNIIQYLVSKSPIFGH